METSTMSVEPLHGGTSLYFATRNANKRSVVLDMESPSDLERLLGLLEGADIWTRS
jgi:crotonobetainyl-CoA:carnitine CoA-transferase CaiB-like acyl-CoA transferase